ncbi:12284_t:CDS:2 [Funneliformis caledonium]|uniref:non-specific serine/threonine protein kinase n=1 Tax=Funneliformis caledonium TaxID=1117310 RepID=A0A9N9F867_9GLOM|nr:12284_t:CDS:2 [Funneliformis caledonium]
MGSNTTNQTIDQYQLGDCIGKGAFGSVYRALNWETGEAVAVKRVKLSNIPKSELNFIMTEIDLLKNLDFGKFPENLVAVYISQVLDGLLYLHDQGVIHRDIKGANILTTKEGLVKLADFGVATKTTSLSDFTVVGSPYWMAPEIIELSGATTSSDIWSVGCVVIELMEGKPPYHHLDPMPALFRIVQDEHPPLPESASPAVKDFLLQCFQKDGNRRVSARRLLKHSWIAGVRKRAKDSVLQQIKTEETIKKVQEWNQAIENPKYKYRRRSESIRSAASFPSNFKVVQQTQSPNYNNPSSSPPSKLPNIPVSTENNRGDNFMGYVPNVINNNSTTQQNRLSVAIAEPDDETDNWDDDFAESLSLTKITAHQNKQISQIDDDNTQTIKPSQFQMVQKVSHQESIPKTNGKENHTSVSINENSSERRSNWEYMQDTVIKLNPTEIKSTAPETSISKFSDLITSNTVEFNTVIAPRNMSSKNAKHARSTSNLEGIIKSQAIQDNLKNGTMRFSDSTSTHESSSDKSSANAAKNIRRVASAEQIDVMVIVTPTPETPSTQQKDLVPNEFYQYHDLSDDDDPFTQMEKEFDEDEMDMDARIARDKYARACLRLEELINALLPNEDEDRLVVTCVQLIELLTEHKELKNHFIMLHGVIPIIDLLEICTYTNVLSSLLKIVNIIIEDNINLQESLCLVGGIPIIMNFASGIHTYDIRLEAAIFIRQICHTSPVILQMFVSCRGLKVLVDFLQEDYAERKELIWIAVNGIWSVFELQSPTPKNDFCRLLSKYGLLDPLSVTLHNVIVDPDSLASGYIDKIVNILLTFSQADAYIKEVMATSTRVVSRIFEVLGKLSPNLMVKMLKCIKNLSMNSNTLEALQNAGAIQVLTGILDDQGPPYVTEISNQVLNAMYNLCRINKSRQKAAANAGIIPHLKYFAYNKVPLKQFALPILCEMAHTGKDCRELLWEHNILQLYLDLMSDPFWQVNAIESILIWLQEETEKVEPILLQPKNIDLILEAFITSKANSFENILEPLHLMTQLSPSVTCALAQQNFFKRLLRRLEHPKAVVRLNLLRILKSVCDVHPQREAVVEQYGLYDIIERMSKEDPAVLVKELTEVLLQGYFRPKEDNSPKLFPSSLSPPNSNGEVSEDYIQMLYKDEELEILGFYYEEASDKRDNYNNRRSTSPFPPQIKLPRKRSVSSPSSQIRFLSPPLVSPNRQRSLSTSHLIQLSPVIQRPSRTLTTSRITSFPVRRSSNYNQSKPIASSSSQSQRYHASSTTSIEILAPSTTSFETPASSTTSVEIPSPLSLAIPVPSKKLQTLAETSTSSTSTSPIFTSVPSNGSLPFPYYYIRKRDSIRNMEALSHHRSYNKQFSRINQTLEHSGTISRNSIVSNSDSFANCSCQGCVLGILRKRVIGGSGKVKKVIKTMQKKTKDKLSKVHKSVNNDDIIV